MSLRNLHQFNNEITHVIVILLLFIHSTPIFKATIVTYCQAPSPFQGPGQGYPAPKTAQSMLCVISIFF